MKFKISRYFLALQLLLAAAFIYQFASEVLGLRSTALPWEWHEVIEISALIGLLMGAFATILVLRDTLKRNRRVENQLLMISGDFANLLMEKFTRWGLTKSEREVALLTLKGFSVAEIATLRGKSQGTIKAQNAAVYKKAGVTSRTQLLLIFIEDLIDGAIETAEGTPRINIPQDAKS
ncbi:LuxR family transcriptional regulator [Amylibacter marinus]|uniref:LuxR family transcriptional regulator n=1 Tax=Amylibacter marinus TaxID=1475483 RepID=A0ABQ5VWZ3_9RHOB|nr:LuxR C-terminal-related transcriptional regulator [Amylibacter marinus]GLQ35751.1 LuxR family transcriptional regulator [Amylibacter marinus]